MAGLEEGGWTLGHLQSRGGCVPSSPLELHRTQVGPAWVCVSTTTDDDYCSRSERGRMCPSACRVPALFKTFSVYQLLQSLQQPKEAGPVPTFQIRKLRCREVE